MCVELCRYTCFVACLLDLLGLKHARHTVLAGGGYCSGTWVKFPVAKSFFQFDVQIHEVRVSEFGLSSLFYFSLSYLPFFLDIVTNMHAVRRRK